MEYDVVVVGASIAGCTAATLFGRAGLRVALVEKHRSPDAYKTLCGHFVLAGTQEMMRRTGLWQPMLAAGGHVGQVANWSPAGWGVAPPDAPAPISLRRERLDPLLRRTAGDTPGVELFLGQSVTGLLASDGRVAGVRTRDGHGREHEHRGRIVVGADGYRSTVAGLARAMSGRAPAEKRAPNNRFGMWAYYRGISFRAAGDTQIWHLDPDVAIVVRTDDDLTMLVAFPTKARLAEFQSDRVGALEAYIRQLPDGPDLSGAERVSKLIGMTDYPCVRRDPAPAPGLFLVGDAAVTGDPQPAVGCGWAFRAAEWLAECLTPALRDTVPMRSAAAAYRRRLRFILRHDRLARQAALGRPANPVQRALVRAAAVDPDIGRRAYLFAMRASPVSGLLNPATVARAMLISATGGRAARK
jgi:2-polyprenyl-6-methoxyphenol hydroxylase-like FAD-dependent oxidoreductase